MIQLYPVHGSHVLSILRRLIILTVLPLVFLDCIVFSWCSIAPVNGIVAELVIWLQLDRFESRGAESWLDTEATTAEVSLACPAATLQSSQAGCVRLEGSPFWWTTLALLLLLILCL